MEQAHKQSMPLHSAEQSNHRFSWLTVFLFFPSPCKRLQTGLSWMYREMIDAINLYVISDQRNRGSLLVFHWEPNNDAYIIYRDIHTPFSHTYIYSYGDGYTIKSHE